VFLAGTAGTAGAAGKGKRFSQRRGEYRRTAGISGNAIVTAAAHPVLAGIFSCADGGQKKAA